MQETMLNIQYIAIYFIPSILLIIFFESAIIIPYVTTKYQQCTIWKKVIDVALINIVTNFFMVFVLYCIDLFSVSDIHARTLGMLLYIFIFPSIKIIIPFVEAKYYRTVWHIWSYPYKNCLYITILANIASAIVWILLHALIVRLY